MRVYALYILVAFLAIYAWKDWFKSLCGLILLMAVLNHEDMPKNIMGIQGLNPWNVLFGMVVLAWLAARRQEGLRWDMPRYVSVLLLLYVGVILVGFLRAVFDRAHLEGYPLKSLVSEELINTVKWALPGVLLFDGCRTRRRLRLALICILVMYSLVAVQVISRMPFSSALEGGRQGIQRIRLKVCSSIGYSAVDMSVFLAGASWGVVACIPLARRRTHIAAILASAGITAFGQALTGGRAGYLAWGTIGLVLCILRWRRYLILAPVVSILVFFAFPGAAERALTGFGQTSLSGQSVTDESLVLSGRSLVWPVVVAKIGESPVLGYGRLAMRRTGLTDYLGVRFGYGEAFSHPHNIHLEWLLDNGIVGFLPVLFFFVIVVLHSARLFRDPNPWCVTVGGMALSLVLAQLIAGIGSQHFYPRESTIGMWAVVFLALRVSCEHSKARIHSFESMLDTGTVSTHRRERLVSHEVELAT